MDTWSHETKQSQTKPILPDLPLPAKRKTSLTSFVTRPYATTPQTQKQTQTKPISPRTAPTPPTKTPRTPLSSLLSHLPTPNTPHASSPAGFSLTNRLKSFTITPVQGRTGNEFFIWWGKKICPEAVHVFHQQSWQRH